MKTAYMVLTFIDWDQMKLRDPLNRRVPLSPAAHSGQGYAPIFLDRDEALAAWPGRRLLEIQLPDKEDPDESD